MSRYSKSVQCLKGEKKKKKSYIMINSFLFAVIKILIGYKTINNK